MLSRRPTCSFPLERHRVVRDRPGQLPACSWAAGPPEVQLALGDGGEIVHVDAHVLPGSASVIDGPLSAAYGCTSPTDVWVGARRQGSLRVDHREASPDAGPGCKAAGEARGPGDYRCVLPTAGSSPSPRWPTPFPSRNAPGRGRAARRVLTTTARAAVAAQPASTAAQHHGAAMALLATNPVAPSSAQTWSPDPKTPVTEGAVDGGGDQEVDFVDATPAASNEPFHACCCAPSTASRRLIPSSRPRSLKRGRGAIASSAARRRRCRRPPAPRRWNSNAS